MNKRIVITGGAGFIGHHLVNHLLIHTDWDIIVFDKLTYASSGYDRLRDINCFDDKRVHMFTLDIEEPLPIGVLKEIEPVDFVVHMAAETHVDRSIEDAMPFVRANMLGTASLLESFKGYPLKAFAYFSTDEVFGPAPAGVYYKEWDRYNSTNPYSASKAGGEELCLAYANTYKMPMIITHTMNVFGERQHPEKYIPMVIKKVLKGEKVMIHSDPTKTISGSRCWIHARNVADGILFLLKDTEKYAVREKYNIAGEELSNFEMAQVIADVLNKNLNFELVDFHSSRPGHDLRYALDRTKMSELGWDLKVDLKKSLAKTVHWYLENKKWLNL